MAALPMEVEIIGGRGTWAGVRGGITIVPKVSLVLGERRGSEVDGEVTVDGSVVDAEMSAVKAGMEG